MTTYTYVQARYDFGVRKWPTLGLMFHGAEAEAGVVGYLSRNPARNVSANFVCERSGRMVQMLTLTHASGSLNPADRSTDKAYYGATHLKAVLGSYWRDPNAAVISVEIEMYAKSGPNAAQVKSLIAWSNDMVGRFPTIRGALGHADQTNTKGCPGTTAAMKSVFAGIGGHGLWAPAQENTDLNTLIETLPFGGSFSIPANVKVDGFKLDAVAGTLGDRKSFGPTPTPSMAHYDAVVTTTVTRGGPFLRVVDGALAGYLIPAAAVTETPNAAPSTGVPPAELQALIAADRAKARIVYA